MPQPLGESRASWLKVEDLAAGLGDDALGVAASVRYLLGRHSIN